MNIRPMTIDDYEKIYALWMSCTGMGLNNVDDTKEGIGRFLARNPHTCFVAEDQGVLTGAIISGHDGRRGWIYHTAVLPQRRREGIAAALARTAMDALKKEGITKVAGVVFNRNTAGNAFWEKQGFTVRTDITYRNKAIVEMIRHDT